MQRKIKVGLLGLGTVGAGVINTLQQNHEEINARTGATISIAGVCVRDLTKTRTCTTTDLTLTTDAKTLVTDPSINVVIELMGGIEPALSLVKTAIQHGKHVITANKALLARHGAEIFTLAKQHQVVVAFEAAVAAGVPIIRVLRDGLSANKIKRVAGIINGTCNYILTEMIKNQAEFADVLTRAQQLGYAEADPSFDIDGIDAAHKLTILAALAFGIPLAFNEVTIEPLHGVSRIDLNYAQELGYAIKYLGIAEAANNGFNLRVHPCLIKHSELLAHVDGVLNAVHVESEPLGASLYYGAGAGAKSTASGVVADLIDVVRMLQADAKAYVEPLAWLTPPSNDVKFLPLTTVQCPYYLRLRVKDEPGVLAQITKVFGELGISIECLLQKDVGDAAGNVPIVLITHTTIEERMQQAMAAIRALKHVDPSLTPIRVYQ